MADHFTLDIDPESLKTVKTWLGGLSDHLHTKGVTVAGTPGEIGEQWTGATAVSVKGEMTGLGELMKGPYSTNLESLATAVGTLESEYRTALDETLPDLNQRWEAAQTTYDDAVGEADDAYDENTDPGDGPPLSRFEREELWTIRNNAVGTAQETLTTTQGGLEEEYQTLVTHLDTKTGNLNTALVDHTPVEVPASAVEDYQTDYELPPVPLDKGSLLDGLTLTGDHLDQVLADYRAQKREEAEADLEDLQQAIDDGDHDAITAAMNEIGENAEDPYYSGELVDVLGPEGVLELYNDIEGQVHDMNLNVDEDHEAILALNDTIAAGISTQSDEEFADFLTGFMDQEYSGRMWEVIAASEYADGRVNAAAIAYYSQAVDPQTTTGRQLVPHLLHYAYEDPTKKMEQWDENSSGEDLARFFSHLSDEEQDDLLFSLTGTFGPSVTSISEDEYSHKADLWGEALDFYRDQGNQDWPQPGASYPSEEIEKMLQYAYQDIPYFEYLEPHIEDLVTDPQFLTWYIDDIWENGVSHSSLTNAMKLVDADAEELMGQIVALDIEAGMDPNKIAEKIGFMLRTEELLGDNVKLDGVIKSLFNSAVSAAGSKNPLTGPTLGVFNALLAEFERLEAADQAWEDAHDDNYSHNLLAINLYTQLNGEIPGFDQWLEDHDRGGDDDPNALIDYYQEQLGSGEEWAQTVNDLATSIDEARDEQ